MRKQNKRLYRLLRERLMNQGFSGPGIRLRTKTIEDKPLLGPNETEVYIHRIHNNDGIWWGCICVRLEPKEVRVQRIRNMWKKGHSFRVAMAERRVPYNWIAVHNAIQELKPAKPEKPWWNKKPEQQAR